MPVRRAQVQAHSSSASTPVSTPNSPWYVMCYFQTSASRVTHTVHARVKALRMSMEEEQARQAAAAQAAAQASGGPSTSAPPAAAPQTSAPAASAAQPAAASTAAAADEDEEDEDAMLARALAMSEEHDVEMAEGESEEDEIKRAMESGAKGNNQQK